MIRHHLLTCLLSLSALAANETNALDPNRIAIRPGQTLDYDRATFEQLAGSYTHYSGFPLEIPEELKAFQVRVFAAGPLTNSEVARLIENSFLLNGCVIKRPATGKFQLARGAGPWRRPAGTEKRIALDPNPEAVVIPAGQKLHMENMTAQECANLLHLHTGKRILISPSLENSTIRLSVPGPLTNEQVATAITTALENFGMILKKFTPHEGALFPISTKISREPGRSGPVRVRRVPRPPSPPGEDPQK